MSVSIRNQTCFLQFLLQNTPETQVDEFLYFLIATREAVTLRQACNVRHTDLRTAAKIGDRLDEAVGHRQSKTYAKTATELCMFFFVVAQI